MNIPQKHAFLILSNNTHIGVTELYKEISRGCSTWGEIFLVFDETNGSLPENFNGLNCYCFSDKILSELSYVPIKDTLVPGSNHFPLLKFYLANPDYDYYWYIEDDVRFTGEWKCFFDIFNKDINADFISSNMRTFEEEPLWYWWDTLLHKSRFIPYKLRIRSFNPIMRISKPALDLIHKALFVEKWQGHHEVLLPTFLALCGFEIMDFGGTGRFVKPGYENRFYVNDKKTENGGLNAGTMRFRPNIHELPLKNKLYHPVKFKSYLSPIINSDENS